MSKKAPEGMKHADLSSEEKIKEAARIIFTKKGYAATRTRDIANEAGMNLALLNYYYRSKEKLFQQVMMEKLQLLFGVIAPIVNDESTSLDQKFEMLAEQYTTMLLNHPDLPLFVLSEIRLNPDQFKKNLQLEKLIRNSSLIVQLKQKRPDLNPLHFLMNLLGMTVFPFISRPILFSSSQNDAVQFAVMMEERKALIPKWVKALLKA